MIRKFAAAFAGIAWAFRTQNSFGIHLPAAVAVLCLAAYLRLTWNEFAILLLTIGCVLAAELLNTAIEELVKALHPRHDPRIGKALDAAAGAVLVVCIAAVAIAACVFLPAVL